MIVSAHLSNFMSYRDAWVPFGPMTVIVGPNGSGKSNLRRGLEWCLLNRGTFNNDDSKDCIRHRLPSGKLSPSVEVTVVFDDGASVRRYRDTSGANLYTLRTHQGDTIEIGGDGSSVGLGELDDVFDVCGIGVIQYSDGTKIALQVSNDQQDGLFLLGDGTETIDRKLGVVMGIETLEAATKAAAKHTTSAGRSLSAERQRASELEESLATYDGLDTCVEALGVLETLVTERDRAARELESIHTTAGVLAHARAKLLPPGTIEALDSKALEVYAAHSAQDAGATVARDVGAAVDVWTSWRQRVVITPEQLTTVSEVLAVCDQLYKEAVVAQEAATHAAGHANMAVGMRANTTSLGTQVSTALAEYQELVANQVVCPVTGEIEEHCGAKEKQG